MCYTARKPLKVSGLRAQAACSQPGCPTDELELKSDAPLQGEDLRLLDDLDLDDCLSLDLEQLELPWGQGSEAQLTEVASPPQHCSTPDWAPGQTILPPPSMQTGRCSLQASTASLSAWQQLQQGQGDCSSLPVTPPARAPGGPPCGGAGGGEHQQQAAALLRRYWELRQVQQVGPAARPSWQQPASAPTSPSGPPPLPDWSRMLQPPAILTGTCSVLPVLGYCQAAPASSAAATAFSAAASKSMQSASGGLTLNRPLRNSCGPVPGGLGGDSAAASRAGALSPFLKRSREGALMSGPTDGSHADGSGTSTPQHAERPQRWGAAQRRSSAPAAQGKPCMAAPEPQAKRARVECNCPEWSGPCTSCTRTQQRMLRLHQESSSLRHEVARLSHTLRLWALQGFITPDQALNFLCAGIDKQAPKPSG